MSTNFAARLLPILIVISSLAGCAHGGGGEKVARDFEEKAGTGLRLQREFLQVQDDAALELFIAHEEGRARPVVVLLHGFQGDGESFNGVERSEGGFVHLMSPMLEFVQDGFAVVSVSVPGYGASTGPADFAGPSSQARILTALEWIRARPWADPKRVALVGVSRGATLAAMVAARDPKLTAAVFVAGLYDLAADLRSMRNRKVSAAILKEIGERATVEALAARSPRRHLSGFRCPVMVLHGSDDDRGTVARAGEFVAELKASGRRVEFVRLEGKGHSLGRLADIEPLRAFLRRELSAR